MARNIITGIDPGTSMVRVVVMEQKKDGTVAILGVAQKQSEGFKRGYVVNMDDAAKSINSAVKAAEKSSGFPIKEAIISVGGISLNSIRSKGSIMISKADGEVSENDVKRVIEQSESNLSNILNKIVIQAFPLVYKIDNSIVQGRPAGFKGTKLEVETLFITCLNQHFYDLKKTAEMAGVAIDDITASPLATAEAVLTKYQKETGCVLANIGASTVSVAVFEEGNLISLEVFNIGSTYITKDIALGMQLSLEDAEKLKTGTGSDIQLSSKRKLNDIVEARLNDIFDLIEAHLKKINRNEMLPAGIILTGGGSNLINLEDIAKDSLRLPAKIGKLLVSGNNSLNLSFASSSIKEQITNDPSWSVALGLCLNKLKNDSGNAGNINIFKKAGKNVKDLFRWFIP